MFIRDFTDEAFRNCSHGDRKNNRYNSVQLAWLFGCARQLGACEQVNGNQNAVT
jgi:hypothetical protein